MPKRIKIPVRSLGSEVEDPTVPTLATWIASHRGMEADLITYKLEESLQVQVEVNTPAAGGRFFQPHLISSFTGVDEGTLIDEPGTDLRLLTEDAARIVSMRKNAWISLPAPQLWGMQDHYYCDDEEFRVALCRCTKTLMRTMRDRGIKGHILLCDVYIEEEIEELTGPKVLFFAEAPDSDDLGLLLEHQRNVAVTVERLPLVLRLLDEFEIDHLVVVDPTKDALLRVQSHFDPGAFEAGGYCKKDCSRYWARLIDSAFITR
jgi:hypothetical protein